MGIKCGIVGLPNVGKSSLFNILSEGKAEAANYPFCTIEPNVGVVMVPDSRLDQLSAINNPEEVIPSIVEFVDIAGLVEGASQGEGLGNKFWQTFEKRMQSSMWSGALRTRMSPMSLMKSIQ